MVRTGEVTDKAGDTLFVVFERPEACAHCNGCLKKDCTRVEIRGDAEPGDLVDVEMPDKSVVGASLLAYIVPLVMLLAGMFAGMSLRDTLGVTMDANLFGALCGGVLLAIGFGVVYLIDRNLRGRATWQPRVVAVHRKTP